MTSTRTATGRAPWIATAILAVVAIALAITLVVFHLPSRHGHQGFSAEQYGAPSTTETVAVTAAKQTLINSLTYTRKTFAADFARTLAGMTGALKSDLTKDKAATLAAMTKGGYDLKGAVTNAALEQGGKTVVVLVSATGYKVKANVPTEVSALRAEVTMTLVKGTWLASDIEDVGLV